MSVIKINLDQPTQEFEIGGKTYTLYYDDESMQNQLTQMRKFYEHAKKADEITFENMSDEDQKKTQEESIQVVKQTIDTFFGEGSFVEIYETAGKSMLILFTVIEEIGKFIYSKTSGEHNEKRATYTKKKK
ncbi:hypothetical protein PJ311_18465 [Bacillus sp. CLL-7-23]|uniref:Phage protein n=1 Tax=Bacillus changyiensis TaxID=3004103 RepID=A0ABT4X8A5_9BACI|nr:hypothetical protein [Bacillus changyiensis]MDA1477266.1 hypothetical protein [Bacillus changyiensis]MDA7028526.1 hypothetical protein [Bacillus changyiensis]